MKFVNLWAESLYEWLENTWQLYVILFIFIAIHALLFSSLGYINVFLADLTLSIFLTLLFTFMDALRWYNI